MRAKAGLPSEYARSNVDHVLAASPIRALILGFLAKSGAPQTPAQIVDAVGVPRESANVSIRTLQGCGYVEVGATMGSSSRLSRLINITPEGKAALEAHARQLADFAGLVP
jgi:DNA-binding MarR family transcriptional regulator